MAVLVTGATGYVGSYVAAALLARDETLLVLVRAASRAAAEERLWQAWQLHMDAAAFARHLGRVRIVPGDLTQPGLGLPPEDRRVLVESTSSIIHAAAALNRRSERACLNVNVRGTLAILELARAAHEHHGLRRFSHVSTVAVAGERLHEVVREDDAIDWNRRDYDPYGRTKKLCEHLVRELLPGVPRTVFRPSIVMGDSRFPATTQFDMVRALSFLAGLPMLPFRPLDRLDVVPADWVGEAIVDLHLRPAPRHETYHLSAGRASPTYRSLSDVLAAATGRKPPAYVPGLARPSGALLAALSRWAPGELRRGARLLGAFWPYLLWDTVFENTRAVSELGRAPAPFGAYCAPLLEFARAHAFRYPLREREPRRAPPESRPAAPPPPPARATAASPRFGNGATRPDGGAP
jgi:nucleoside-diphosphate-sugar epimerase